MAGTKKGGKKGRKIGRDADKCKRYMAPQTREKNKVKRVLKSQGKRAAETYALKYSVVGHLKKLLATMYFKPKPEKVR